MENISWELFCIFCKNLLNFEVNLLPPVWRQILINLYQTKRRLFAGVPDFTNTRVKTARISKYRKLCIECLHSRNTRHFKLQPSERIPQTLWPSYTSHVISSYYVSRRKLPSPTVYINTLIHAHFISHTILTYRIGLDKPLLPAAEFCV